MTKDTIIRKSQIRSASRRRTRGFTMIELMIVMAILSILVGMAALIYDKVIRHAREAALKQDLQTMRHAIDNYTLDKQQAPQSLQDLVDAHYLREVPNDPVCRTNDWEVHIGDTVLSPDQTSTGVDDVHSGCPQTAMDGTSYTTW